MSIFSENPKFFRLNRKSDQASDLSSSISNKLLQFIDSYTDDVLSEYITVLVCNGKHQYQARDDLEAFLGKRSGEFVTWLWDFVSKHYHESTGVHFSISNVKDSTVTSSHERDSDKDMRVNGLNFQNFVNGGANKEMTEGAMLQSTSLQNSSIPLCENEFRQSSLGFVMPADEFNDENIQSEPCGSEIQRYGDSSIQYADKYKISSNKFNSVPNPLLNVPKKEPVCRNLQASISEDVIHKHIISTKDSRSSFSPREIYNVPLQKDKQRLSVWDRLGKPCEDPTANDKTNGYNAYPIDRVFDKPLLSEYAPNNMQSPRMSDGNNYSGEYRKSEHGVGAVSKIQVDSIRQKRHCVEIDSNPHTRIVRWKGEGNMDPQPKINSQNFKKSALITETFEAVPTAVQAAKLDLDNEQSMVSNLKPLQAQVIDMKQKLYHVEMEMSKLKSKQVEMVKDGKLVLLSNSGGPKHLEEESELRTILVTNVHFAATTGALSKYFSACGVVLNVTALTDKTTSQTKGSMYVTFASKESVDRAVALSGISFFSRTIKIVRKSEADSATLIPSQPRIKLPQTQSFHNIKKASFDKPYVHGSCLQWRRDNNFSNTTETSYSSKKLGDV